MTKPSGKLIDQISGGQHVRQPRTVAGHFDTRMFAAPEKEVRQYVETLTKHWRESLPVAAKAAIIEKTVLEVRTTVAKPKIDNDLKAVLVVARQSSDFIQCVALGVLTSELNLAKTVKSDWLSVLFGVLLSLDNLHFILDHFKLVVISDPSPDNPARRQLRQLITNLLCVVAALLADEQKRILLNELPNTLTALAETNAYRIAYSDADFITLLEPGVPLDSATLAALLEAAPMMGLRSARASFEGVGKFIVHISGRLNLLRVELPREWPPKDTHAFLLAIMEKPISMAIPLRILLSCRLPGQEQNLLKLLQASEAVKFNAHPLMAKFLPKDSRVAAEIFTEFDNLEFYENSDGNYARWTGRNFRSLASGLETCEAERWLRVLMGVVARRPQAMAMAWATCLEACRKIYAIHEYFTDPGLEPAFLELLAWRGSASALDLRLALRELLARGLTAYEPWMGAYFRPLLDLSPSSSGLVVLAPQLLDICSANFARLPAEGHKLLYRLLVLRQAAPPAALLPAVTAVAKRRRLSVDEWEVALLLGSGATTLLELALYELDTSIADQDFELASLRAIARVLTLPGDLSNQTALTTRLVELVESAVSMETLSEPIVDELIIICRELLRQVKNPALVSRFQQLRLPETGLLLRLGTAPDGETAAAVVNEIFENLYENALDAEVLEAISRRLVGIPDQIFFAPDLSPLKTLLSERLLEPIESPFRPRLLLTFFRHGRAEYLPALLESASLHAGEISLLSSRSRRDAFQVETVEKVVETLAASNVAVDEHVLGFVATALFVSKVPEQFRNRVFLAFAQSMGKKGQAEVEISDDSDCVIELD